MLNRENLDMEKGSRFHRHHLPMALKNPDAESLALPRAHVNLQGYVRYYITSWCLVPREVLKYLQVIPERSPPFSPEAQGITCHTTERCSTP